MQAKLIDEHDRVYALIFGTGEDPMAELAQFAGEHKLSASSFTAIGAFRRRHDPASGLALIRIRD